ncbi:Nad-dependent epimerase dehydratase [Lasiodiplodia theobromae]|uniref:Nad-dependent epimerase dehydratase n=1 Tax=Lasiodiplodia theobromae TaxID=45133 RepID=UPI0015C30085|nr:Nad-dependent epimerase dehydratase [Lasiodiplodia theobromae]KAF4546746.1 Nad-dependent epimerase dehydratase [Lasiodiplodia theobromae]
MNIDHSLLPTDSLVLVTAANGFLASHIANQLLHAGFRVRGTVRDAASPKYAWLQYLFDASHGPGRFHLVSVPDIAADGAFDDAVKGVNAVAHVGSVVGKDASGTLDSIVAPVIKGALEPLKSAAREDSVKSFVFTSTSNAAYSPRAGEGGDVDEGTWNEKSVRELLRLGEEGGDAVQRTLAAYSAILPSVNFGRSLDPKNQGHPTTSGWPVALATDTVPEYMWSLVPPQYYIDVEDTALLHVAALTRPDLKGNRIFGFVEEFNWNTLLHALRRIYPEKVFYEDREGQDHDLSRILGASKAEKILRDMGRPGWKGLEESLRENLEDIEL